MSSAPDPKDPIALTQALIRCPSVTPVDAGALDVLQSALTPLGFQATRLLFDSPHPDEVDNLFARLGRDGPAFCFAGHTDVVPVGKAESWSVDPFAGDIIDGQIFGRGASDMKGAIAAFVAATARFLDHHGPKFGGSISLLITGDEEGPARNGTRKVLEWMEEEGLSMDACLVGEPTNPKMIGEMMKIGRRGSLIGHLSVTGQQGHVAYPHLADNPIPGLLQLLTALETASLDRGDNFFEPSNLEITTIDVGNEAPNVIPGMAKASFSVRFGPSYQGDSLESWLVQQLDKVGVPYTLETDLSGEAFLTEEGKLTDLIAQSVKKVTGMKPEMSTSGGTSDARFIKDMAPVAEFGLLGQTMHKVDERAAIADIHQLSEIYFHILEEFFDSSGGI